MGSRTQGGHTLQYGHPPYFSSNYNYTNYNYTNRAFKQAMPIKHT